MKIVAGIDEAGLGPLLGPLCLGYAAFEIPGGDAGLRHALRRICAKSPSRSEKRIVVCDSKVLHRGRKLAALERTALAFLAAANDGKPPRTIRDVLRLGLTSASALNELPWYRDLDEPVPLEADPEDIARISKKLLIEMRRQRVKIVELGTRVIPEAELNRLFESTGNKSIALFESLLPVLQRMRRFAADRGTLLCDRHGGRASYAPLLARAFHNSWVAIAHQSPDASLYRVRMPEGTLRVGFAQRGESRWFACALASCLAKYSRELAMNRWNNWFATIAPGVRPTAGYYTDAIRYLKQADSALKAAGVPRELMIRSR